MQMAATAFRAATQHGLDSTPRSRGNRPAGLFHISRPVLAQDLREVHELASQRVVEQALLDFASTAFADLGHMQIDQRRSQITVPKIGAHLPDGHPFFEQMGREAVPQAMTGGALFDPRCGHHHAQSRLHTGDAHRLGGRRHGGLQGA